MKQASGELSLMVVAVIAVGVLLGLVTGFLPRLFDTIEVKFEELMELNIMDR